MSNLTVQYLGIALKNPIIVGASNLVNDIDNIKRAEEAGAAAVVYKSLFEEQIQLENLELSNILDDSSDRHAEQITSFPGVDDAGPVEYLYKVKKAKESVSIPVFASLNAVYKESWVDYARQLEQTGVDGLEINFYAVPRDVDVEGKSIEDSQIEILKAIIASVKIPVSVKLSPYYANPLNLIKKMDNAGAKSFVLFNRFFQPNIDTDSIEHVTDFNLSSDYENKLALRFCGLLHGNIKANVCGSTGIYSGNDVVKMLLAGADCVQVVSTLYKNKISYISTMLSDIERWMNAKKFNSIEDFKGKLSNKTINDPFVYKRAQYVDMLMKKSTEVLQRNPLV